MTNEGKGKFIVLEGPDGVGKGTVLSAVEAWFQSCGIDYVRVQDPSSFVADGIRMLLLDPRYDWEPSSRLYLYLAARAELLYKQVLPALKAGKIVLSDRYVLSTYAYQGEFFSREQIDKASEAGGLSQVQPDLQIVLLANKSFREVSEEDAMGKYCIQYRNTILARYEELAKDPSLNIRSVMVDGKDREEVFAEVQHLLQSFLNA